jgi:hypothetical protein
LPILILIAALFVFTLCLALLLPHLLLAKLVEIPLEQFIAL